MSKLSELKNAFLSIEKIALALDITIDSARVTASRYVKSGLLLRPARDLYVLKSRLADLSKDEKMQLANLIQPSSYISFMTALSYYEISTQMQQNYFESSALIRSKNKDVEDLKFRYFRIQRKLYFGFEKINNIFIAKPEKALADSLYMMSLGRYSLDISSLSFKSINNDKLDSVLKRYPRKTVKLWEKIRERIN